jgi:hypothetical protein
VAIKSKSKHCHLDPLSKIQPRGNKIGNFKFPCGTFLLKMFFQISPMGGKNMLGKTIYEVNVKTVNYVNNILKHAMYTVSSVVKG